MHADERFDPRECQTVPRQITRAERAKTVRETVTSLPA